MELKETTKKILKLFNCNIEELPDKIMEKVQDKDIKKTIKEYEKIIKEDPNTDWLQAVYQRNLADRDEKSQDFTPKTLSKLCAEITKHNKEKKVYDMCSGSGSLTLQKNQNQKGLTFHLHELDGNVLPFLLFNLFKDNVKATVTHGDVLTGEIFGRYIVDDKGVRKDQTLSLFEKYDTVISNPPFNLKVDDDFKYSDNVVIGKSNQNFSFVLKGLDVLNDEGKGAFILPNGICTSISDLCAREYLVENGHVEAVISCPDKMFESTNIPVTVLLLSKKPVENTVFMTLKDLFQEETRDMRGDLHMTNRVYHKLVKTFADEHIQQVRDTLDNPIDEVGFSKVSSKAEIKEQAYNLSPSLYVTPFMDEVKHRSFREIMHDLKRVMDEKNRTKLTINAKMAEQILEKEEFELLMEQKELIEESRDLANAINNSMQELKRCNPDFEELQEIPELPREDYFTVSKSKGIVKLENKGEEVKEDLSFAVSHYTLMIHYFNNEEMKYLAELRDKLLPLLMEGVLNVEGVTLSEN